MNNKFALFFICALVFSLFLTAHPAYATGDVPSPEFPSSPISAVTEDSDNYGMNIPNQQFPDLRDAPGDLAASTLSAELTNSGTGWIRTDASPTLYRNFYNDSSCSYSQNPTLNCSFSSKLGSQKIIASINHITLNFAAVFCSEFGIYWGPTSDYPYAKQYSFNLDDWKSVVNCVSKVFAGKVQAYEIWNEPTVTEFQSGFQDGSANHYFQMLQAASEIIRENDPEAIIVGLGGIQPFYGGDDGAERIQHDKDFSNALIASNAGDLVDAISLHAYDWDYYNTENIEKIYQNTKYYKDTWGKPVWITESGHRNESVNGTQSGFIKYGYSALLNAGAEKIFWFALHDHFVSGNPQASGEFGVVGRPVQGYMKDFISTPKTGLLRIETSPAIAATMSVSLVSNPSVHYESQWGVDWDRLQAGTYKVTFSHAGGYFSNGKQIIIPAERTFTIEAGKITNILADFSIGQTREDKIWDDLGDSVDYSTGLLRVQTDPAAAAIVRIRSLSDSTSDFQRSWAVDWEALNTGSYEISFSYPYSTINGRAVVIPPNRTITIEKGKTTSILADLTTGQALVSNHNPEASPTYPSGRIRIQTSAAYPATITVQSSSNSSILFTRDWGVDWERLEQGNYSVTITNPSPPTGSFTSTVTRTFSISPQQITELVIQATNAATTTSYYSE